jgi:hypothetical protein
LADFLTRIAEITEELEKIEEEKKILQAELARITNTADDLMAANTPPPKVSFNSNWEEFEKTVLDKDGNEVNLTGHFRHGDGPVKE